MIHRYTVIGNPIDHSLSPAIHALFAAQTQRKIEYTKTLATDDTFADIVKSFMADGGLGCNVTAPFKPAAVQLCNSLTEAATRAQAVNTIKRQADGSLFGHNTDGSGLVTDLTDTHNVTIKDATILIAGAGGATRGLLEPLLAQKPKHILIGNRSVDKATVLATEFSDLGEVSGMGYDAIPNRPVDLIINATSTGWGEDLPELPSSAVTQNTTAYELSYGRQTPFMQWATDAGAGNVIDGLGMLLEQAADAFFMWEDVRPKTRLITPQLLS